MSRRNECDVLEGKMCMQMTRHTSDGKRMSETSAKLSSPARSSSLLGDHRGWCFWAAVQQTRQGHAHRCGRNFDRGLHSCCGITRSESVPMKHTARGQSGCSMMHALGCAVHVQTQAIVFTICKAKVVQYKLRSRQLPMLCSTNKGG